MWGGRLCVAMARLGAKSVIGIDYGEENIIFAKKMKDKFRINNINYLEANAYELPFDDNTFDVITANGVFHHLEQMDKALKETYRVLQFGGFFWLYVIGTGGMINALCEATKIIMRGVNKDNVLNIFISSGLSQHKIYTLMDNFYAIYFYNHWKDVVSVMQKIGFKDIKRLEGGNKTDYNLSRIKEESYGQEKFGEGEIRLTAYK